FNAKTIAANAEILAKLDDYKKVSIIHSYMGSRTLIARLCDTLFPEPPKRKIKELPKPPDLGPMWDDLIFDLANTKGYAGVSAAKHANAIEALQYLDREIVHAKQQANHGKSTI